MHEIGYKNCRLKIQYINRIDRILRSASEVLKGLSDGSLCILTVESGLYYLEPQFGGQTRTFHRPHLSYLAIDFHYLHFDLQMKVNAGGSTHQYKLESTPFSICSSLRINSCICAHAV